MPTIKQLTAAAKSIGIVRGKGTYNGAAYWRYAESKTIITRQHLMEILGY
jgi:hypothetical protein